MTNHRLDNLVLSFFGFSRLPFSKNISSKEIFSTQTYKEAFARLEFGISDEDIMLLTGPVGSGKSVVLGSLIHSIDLNSYIPIYIRGNNLKEGELYKAILIGLDHAPPRYSQAAKRLFYRLVPELTKKPVVIVDDAQEIQLLLLLLILTRCHKYIIACFHLYSSLVLSLVYLLIL